MGGHRDRRAIRAAAVRRATARQGADPAEAAGGTAVLRPSGSEVHADPVDVAGVAALPPTRVLAWSGVAGDDVAVLVVLRAPRVVRTRADAQARRAAPGQRRHLRGVLRAVHRRTAGQHAAVVDRRGSARLARLVIRPAARADRLPWSASRDPR